MFRDNTVFVIGAGASAEFGLPLGHQLLTLVKANCRFEVSGWTLISGVEEIYKAIVNRYTKHDDIIAAHLEAMGEINRAIDFAGSIDEFINRHSDDPIIAEVGKLQIAYAISEAERSSHFSSISKHAETQIEWNTSETWMHTFAQLLFDGVKNGDVETVGNNITIICFNYDRCIELFLTDAIVKAFRNVPFDQAYKIVERMNIIHPYGSLGSLRHHTFGHRATPQDIRAMSENIVTWSESQRSDITPKIQTDMSGASTVVFLGFAFAPQNMKLLSVQNSSPYDEQVCETFATAYGYNSVIEDRLKTKILNLFSPVEYRINFDRVHIQYGMKCADFLKAHSMALVN